MGREGGGGEGMVGGRGGVGRGWLVGRVGRGRGDGEEGVPPCANASQKCPVIDPPQFIGSTDSEVGGTVQLVFVVLLSFFFLFFFWGGGG